MDWVQHQQRRAKVALEMQDYHKGSRPPPGDQTSANAVIGTYKINAVGATTKCVATGLPLTNS